MKQTICSVGDAILLEGFPDGYDITPVKNIVEKADVRLFNLENVLSDRAIYGSTYCGGTWLLAKEDTLDSTLRFGFNGCSFANNHTMDFAYDGLFDTLEAAKKRGLALCGAGGDQCPRALVRWVEPETPIDDPNVKRPNVIEHKADPSMYDISGCNKVGKRISNEIIFIITYLCLPFKVISCHFD